MKSHPLLLEIGCEELPAAEQQQLQESAGEIMIRLLDETGIEYGEILPFISPRRIALLIPDLAASTRAEEELRRGPSFERAFVDGKATAAAEGFARSCGVAVTDLERLETEKGTILAWRIQHPARPVAELLPELVTRWVESLPLRKRMRWGKREESFSRPIRWLLLRFADQALPWQAFGLQSEAHSFGHRVHHPGPVPVVQPQSYSQALLQAKVRANWQERRAYIAMELQRLAQELDCTPVLADALLDEITGLCEWPVILAGGFAEEYLRIPEEVLITVMIQHQRYVPLRTQSGCLAPRYLFVANIESRDAQVVIHGNNRVLRARLADAAFFWDQDRKSSLAARIPDLDKVSFQDGLGSMGDKVRRLQNLAPRVAAMVGADPKDCERAVQLCKSDLLSGMVGEFPELQGIMGSYYARHDGESAAVAQVIGEQYRPAGRDDAIPSSAAGQALALADRIDTLYGFFALGKIPTGDRDPFALRRAALGILRIALEGERSFSLGELTQVSRRSYAATLLPGAEPSAKLSEFFQDRLRVLLREEGFAADRIAAILAVAGDNPLDARRRLESLSTFLASDPRADDLVALIKRVSNLLRKEESPENAALQPGLLQEAAEKALWNAWTAIREIVEDDLAAKNYHHAFVTLASLRDPVDRFFAEVMVLCEDLELRRQRLALLRTLQSAFLHVADFSQLQGRG
ncbi:glycine--tRNA ligase subunit beta [Acidithiobacillus sp. AMEEHan]|uniref:glycine--tRNA ligase subunit beta n=1 Tax=Acidithiobacillus sp. AMEEHan TaxID=2994951 RepID=UPI0027E59C57|nr:glycine--tRNA ligase subunit beta [Acidithiobacillus sp. AMEEHan]